MISRLPSSTPDVHWFDLSHQVARILKPGGHWLYITYRQPHFMKPMLENAAWDLSVELLENGPGSFEYFGFVMTKH